MPTFRPHSVSISQPHPLDLDGRPPGPDPSTHGPRKSENPEGGSIRSPDSVLVSWSATATTPDIRIHSMMILSFASVKVLMLSEASKEPTPPPFMRVAALTLVAWMLSGGQVCSTTGLDPKKGSGFQLGCTLAFELGIFGFGSQLSPLGMCWIETQQALAAVPCGFVARVMPCGPHCRVAAGAWLSLPFVGLSISALACLLGELGVRQEASSLGACAPSVSSGLAALGLIARRQEEFSLFLIKNTSLLRGSEPFVTDPRVFSFGGLLFSSLS